MHDVRLDPTTPLGAEVPRSETFGAVTIVGRNDLAIASLASRRGAPEQTSILGVTLPAPGALSSQGGVTAIWASRGQWMIVAEGREDLDFASEVKAAAPGSSVTDQSDGFVAVDLVSCDGAAPLQRLLEKLVNLDPARLAPGCATRTLLEQLSVFLIRHSETRLTVFAMRSAAHSLWHAVTTAAAFAAHVTPVDV